MKSWLAQGSSGRRVTLLPGTTFLHINGALGKEEAKKGLEMSANVAKIAKVTRIFLACGSTPYKYLKNNRYNKIHDFGKEEAKWDPEMSANTAKVTRIFHAR